MLKLIIFDYDGVIVNSETVVYEALRKLFSSFGHTMTWEYYMSHMGKPVETALRAYYQDFKFDMSFEDFLILRNKSVEDASKKNIRLLPNLLTLFKILTKKRLQLAIASSGTSEYIKENLKRFEIDTYFQYITSHDEVTKSKPDPEVFVKTLKKANVSSTEAIVIEDSPLGIQAAKNAGLFTIALTQNEGNLQTYQQADILCKDLQSIEQIISLLL